VLPSCRFASCCFFVDHIHSYTHCYYFMCLNYCPTYSGAAVDGTAKEFAFIPEALAKYQDPAQADSITRVQRDLDEVGGFSCIHRVIFIFSLAKK
jgi:hypothetical protein